MKQEKKIAIVTGANKGIGFEIARQLIENNFAVIIGARDKKKGMEAADKLSADFIQLDIAEEKSISTFVTEVKKKYGNIDVLVNNAAILEKTDSDMLTVKTSVINSTLTTNAIGPILLSQSIFPLMKKGSRIINISSGGGSMTDEVGGWSPIYCSSKSLLNAFTRQLAHFLRAKEISVNAVCPGWVRTDMGGKNAPRNVSQGADTAVWLATETKIPSGKFFRDRREIPF
jgi:NAD(P)-dependent dehydrogenase (short-subunit alcohol dehydrogenase family)